VHPSGVMLLWDEAAAGAREQTLRSMHKTDSTGGEQEAPCTKWAGIDAIRRTAVYVIRMPGGVGGEELRGSPLSRLGATKMQLSCARHHSRTL
jgi:hypothetical protein